VAALQALDRLTVIEHRTGAERSSPSALQTAQTGRISGQMASSEPMSSGFPRAAERRAGDVHRSTSARSAHGNSAGTLGSVSYPSSDTMTRPEPLSRYSPGTSETDDESTSSDSTVPDAVDQQRTAHQALALGTAWPRPCDLGAAEEPIPEPALSAAASHEQSPPMPIVGTSSAFAAVWSQRRGPRPDAPSDAWRWRSAAWATDTGTPVGSPPPSSAAATGAGTPSLPSVASLADAVSERQPGAAPNGTASSGGSGMGAFGTSFHAPASLYGVAGARAAAPPSFRERRSRSRSRRSQSSSDAGHSRSPRGRSQVRSQDDFLYQLQACSQPLYSSRSWDARHAAQVRQRVEALNDLVDWAETQPDAFAPDAAVYSALLILVHEYLAAREPPPMSEDERLALADDEVFVPWSLPGGQPVPTSVSSRSPAPAAGDTDPTAGDTWWPQVECAYALVLEFLDPERHDTDVRQQRLAGLVAVSPTTRVDLWERLIPHILRLFQAPAYEREYVKICLYRIYARFRDLRTLIRSRISCDLCLPYRYDGVAYAQLVRGLADLLSILVLIIQGLAVPLKREHAEFYCQALLPLHAPDGYVVYATELIECALQFAAKDSTLATATVMYLLRHWPVSHTRKEMLFLDEMASLLEQQWRAAPARGLEQQQQQQQEAPDSRDASLVPLVFRRLARCMTSAHRDVAEEALLLLLENDSGREYGSAGDPWDAVGHATPNRILHDNDDDDDQQQQQQQQHGRALLHHTADESRPAGHHGVHQQTYGRKQHPALETPRSWFRQMLLLYRSDTFPVLAEAIYVNARHWDSRIQQLTRQLQTLLMNLDADTYETCLRQHRSRMSRRGERSSSVRRTHAAIALSG